MDLTKWDPRDMSTLRQSINRLFDETFPFPRKSDVWTFPVDIQDSAEKIVIKAEIPGLEKEDIKIHFVNNELSIQGERKSEQREEGARYLKVERNYGSFYRSFKIDVPIKSGEIKANYKNGLLEIILPKEEEVKPKEITINVQE
ncbi:MAG: Molecular chaperone [Desulfotomaculum sp. 46_296]|nr:MAG: Molecular chaperone [Desulfotomaculum sp. 46_296]HAU32644.1 molecular chaperone [Desulfotomaculum sp.]